MSTRDLSSEPGEGWRWASLGDGVGAERLEGAVLELDPGADFGPYRYEYGRELWLLVMAGTALVQNAKGEQALSHGDLVCLPEGPAGGRRVLNPTGEPARVLLHVDNRVPSGRLLPRDRGLGAARRSRR